MKKAVIVLAGVFVILGLFASGCKNNPLNEVTGADIGSFIFEAADNDVLDNDITGTIEGTEVTANVPYGTDVTALVPTVTVAEGATVVPASGEAQDFTDPVTYTVTAADGETTAEYTVTVSVASADAGTACDITGFVFQAADNTALSNDVTGTVGTGTVNASVPFGTDRSALVPTITCSAGASVAPASGAAQDFSTSITYTVTAEDAATTQEYTVTVSEADAVIVGGNVFQELSLDKEVITEAGMHGVSDNYDGTGVGALMQDANRGVAVGDYIYFSDMFNYRIRKFDPATNSVTTLSGNGTSGYTEGSAENAQFNRPQGLAYDGTDLYVADYQNHVIRKVSLADGSTELVAGNPTNGGFADGTGGSAQFYYPFDLCYHDGYLYVADDSNHRVRKIDVSSQEVTTLAGDGTEWHTDGTGADAQFDGVDAIAFDGTDLWVASNDTIRKVTLAGVVTTPYGSPGWGGYTDAFGTSSRFNHPQAIVADGDTLYVSESGNHTIRVIDTGTTGVSTLAGGTQGIEDGTHTAAKLYAPYVQGIIGSTLYFGEGWGHVIRSVDVDTKEVTTLAGSPHKGYFNDGSGVGALCSSPDSATTDGEYLYFTQAGASHIIRKMNLDTLEVAHVAGIHGSDGSVDNYEDSRFNSPGGITTDGDNLYVADSGNHTIRKIVLATGQVSTLAGQAGTTGSDDGTGSDARFTYPTGITTDGTNLYVTDRSNHTIRRIVISTKEVTTLAGTAGELGTDDGTGGDARFYNPYGITTDGSSLYVADHWNHTIRKIDIADAEVTTLAGTAGTSGAVDDIGTAAKFNQPYGISCDGTYLYVTERANDMIRRIDIADAEVTTLGGHPSHTDEWADGTYMDAYFHDPTGAVCDGSNVWIMDRGNQVIRRIQ